ncbi:HNH endonuclease [Lysinibacillus sphaericus]|uniref:HNH endonuclease n=3 Tax=Lysinibacillus TaxID=400634 RepID=W7RF90_LYSSH|nr:MULTISPECIES: HNH endonuclease [Lysinibacillus]MBE5084385.1 HNH endonuclease [Bacillus thuringiensis]ACA38121.1 hypothetical protein Bsph_0496 [Lysinibacillus sphaericus C3-41]AMO32287.1 hypothetical protein AR327_07305 [Lysinibacillus sphaericus]AMR92614.1 hypothetical protein A1T07_21905 [Lysinibacillus sphaericus]ANA46663.1 hypothetical protein A2J09_14575 [Lysinibacillus sphaericus]
MKAYYRNPKEIPKKLIDDINKKKWYENLRDGKNNIRDRWNTTQEDKRPIIREKLYQITNGCCAYCGKKIKISEMDVDHFLPSHKFNYLSYCWLNYIPSCKTCNQSFKHQYYPKSIAEKQIIEHCCQGIVVPFDATYNQNILFTVTQDRIIDPFYDDISIHLTFQPLTYSYKAHTDIGKEMNKIFFRRQEFIEYIEGISFAVKRLVKNNNPRNILDPFINLYGSEFYYNAYWDFWSERKSDGLL